MNSFFFPNVQGHLAYSLGLVLTSVIKGTLIEKIIWVIGVLLLATDVSTTCAEAIFRVKW